MLYLTSLGWLMALPIGLGVVVGHYLDVHFGSGSRWTLALLGLGIGLAVLEALLAGRRMLRR